MKVLMIAPTPFFSDRGCHVRIFEEASSLIKKGNEVTICTYHLGRDTGPINIRRIINVPWYAKLDPGPSCHKLYLDFLLFLLLLWACYKDRPDIIHAHLHEGGFIGLLPSKLLNIPLAMDIQGSLVEELLDHSFFSRNGFLCKVFTSLEKWIYKKAKLIFASSSRSADYIKKAFQISEEKIVVIQDGVDPERFCPCPKKERLRKKLKIPGDKKIIVYLGTLNELEGIEILLEAVSILSVRRGDFCLLLMGYPNVENYRDLAAKSNLKDKVRFTGRVEYEKAPEYLSLGDIAVSAKVSKTEANGKLYNYMAMGLPTVTFDTPVAREALGELGIYAKFGDPLSLAEQLDDTIHNDVLCKELSCKLRDRAKESFSWETRGEEIMESYKRLLKE
ncbi:MAG: glycosyltransferase family 4 protein [Candidatus Omnitrophica bacterium]|nr:glycosyltransferase family 4 protein [Candidatus Omnitrophota bacterium]MBU1134125.1 glycosyltransferase family 4 protein [Candidatus Omnitrophota bacterium]MBU1810106.1 glycosyltransferase family 4 protein [Candidatus Omnitrophota bacterium]MBU2505094.1 glycosyltransferase family 4 protein [Candidatus Omnitrophota bacterium]